MCLVLLAAMAAAVGWVSTVVLTPALVPTPTGDAAGIAAMGTVVTAVEAMAGATEEVLTAMADVAMLMAVVLDMVAWGLVAATEGPWPF